MGDMAEYYADWDIYGGDPGPELKEALTPDSIWTTKTGWKVKVKDMADSHLLRTIQVLRGKSPIGTTFKTTSDRRADWLNVMANVAYSRGLTVPLPDEDDKHAHE